MWVVGCMFGQLSCLLFLSFLTLYVVISIQHKEKNKFISKFGTLTSEKAEAAKSQIINKEILSSSQII